MLRSAGLLRMIHTLLHTGHGADKGSGSRLVMWVAGTLSKTGGKQHGRADPPMEPRWRLGTTAVAPARGLVDQTP